MKAIGQGLSYTAISYEWLIDHDTSSLESFYRLSYWKRLWIHQEVLLGKDGLVFMAGGTMVSERELKSLDIKHHHDSPSILRELLRGDSAAFGVREKLRLCYTVCTFSSNHCKDPRDRIFSLLGIVEWNERIEVDYELSTQRIFRETVNKILAIGDFSFDGVTMNISKYRWGYFEVQQLDKLQKRSEQLADDMGVQLEPRAMKEAILKSLRRPDPVPQMVSMLPILSQQQENGCNPQQLGARGANQG